MNRPPSDNLLLASVRRALADAAPDGPSPALLDAIRREAARRRAAIRRSRRRRLLLLAPFAAAAVAVFAFFLLPPGSDTRVPSASPTPDTIANADAALRLLLLDASSAWNATASVDADDASVCGEASAEESTALAATGDEALEGGEDLLADWEDLSFADALVAWQAIPFGGVSGGVSSAF